MYFVYVIQNEINEMYIGYTSDIEARLKSHNSGMNTSTKGHIWKYVYYEAYLSEKDARQREMKLKQHGQSKRFLKERIQNSIDEGCTQS